MEYSLEDEDDLRYCGRLGLGAERGVLRQGLRRCLGPRLGAARVRRERLGLDAERGGFSYRIGPVLSAGGSLRHHVRAVPAGGDSGLDDDRLSAARAGPAGVNSGRVSAPHLLEMMRVGIMTAPYLLGTNPDLCLDPARALLAGRAVSAGVRAGHGLLGAVPAGDDVCAVPAGRAVPLGVGAGHGLLGIVPAGDGHVPGDTLALAKRWLTLSNQVVDLKEPQNENAPLHFFIT